MRKQISKFLIAAAVSLLTVTSAQAASSGFQFSFFGVNAPDVDEVTGFRLPLFYGKGNVDMTGWDFPLFAYSEMDSLKGVYWSPFLPLGSRVRNGMTGAAFGAFNWHGGEDVGANFGGLNIVGSVTGANVALVNISERANFELGFVNITQEIRGVQIGLLSCAKNGFLPCFIIFNFGGMGGS